MQLLYISFNYINRLLRLNTLRSQLRFWGFMLVLLPSISLMFMFTYYELEHTKQLRGDNLQMMTTMQHTTIDKWFNERASVIRDMANWPVIKRQDAKAINERIQQFLKSQDEFLLVNYVNKDGIITVANPTTTAGVDVSDRLYYHAAKQGKEYISDVISGRGAADGQSIIVFSVPVFNESNQFNGLVIGSVKLTTIDKIMQQFHFGRTGETYLVNQQGLMISESRFIDQMVKTGIVKDTTRLNFSINTEAFRLAREGQAGYAAYTGYRGQEVIGAYRWLDSRNWIIIGEVEETEILEPFYRQISIMFACFLVLIIASLPLTMVLANKLETPIRRLIAGADAMRAGDYSYRIEQNLIDSSVSEIRDLCNIFNYMAENISTKTKTLNRANKELTSARDTALETSVAKSQFLANMSHEIRTPLNAILGMGDLLWDTSLTTEQEKYVRVSRSAGENLLNLINDILDLSKVESGHFSIDKVEFELTDVLEKTCEILALSAHEKGIELSQKIATDTPVNLIGDPARLRQIITNLVGNAVKFTETGEVILEIRKTSMLKNGKLKLIFCVRDTGIGIPQDKLKHIFERFTQVDTSDTRKYGGTGLGLAISKHLVKLMDGRIWAQSTLGVGSTFYFTAVFECGSNRTADSQPSVTRIKNPKILLDESQQEQLKILLVEDAADNRLLIEAYLKKTPHQLDMAINGKIAVEKFKVNRYDLVFMDMQMPVMDGYQATKAIRIWEQDQGLERTPIVALTAHALQEDAGKTREFGCDAHLTKPIKKSVLLEALTQFAGGKQG